MKLMDYSEWEAFQENSSSIWTVIGSIQNRISEHFYRVNGCYSSFALENKFQDKVYLFNFDDEDDEDDFYNAGFDPNYLQALLNLQIIKTERPLFDKIWRDCCAIHYNYGNETFVIKDDESGQYIFIKVQCIIDYFNRDFSKPTEFKPEVVTTMTREEFKKYELLESKIFRF